MAKKHGKAKKLLGAVLLGFLILLLLGAGALWLSFGRFLLAARSVTQLAPNLYAMEFKGDYGFDEFLEKGGADSDQKVEQFLIGYLSRGRYSGRGRISAAPFGCSTICARSKDGSVLFGRNYDWEDSDVLLVRTVPKNGYASVSACCLDFLGFGADYRPDASVLARMEALAAIYVPLDGMNEKGLIVADLMAGDKEKTAQRTDRPDLTTTTALRLLLDRAATVEEALALLEQYDMNSSVDFAHHFAIADASGKSVAVEYVNNERIVTETPILTNHYLAPQKGENGGKQSHARYAVLEGYADKTLEKNEVAAVLESITQKHFEQTGVPHITVWSWVYSPGEKTAEFFFQEDFSNARHVSVSGEKPWISP